MPATQQMSRLVDSPDGVRIAVYHEGNPDGPTVVLVHGFPDSHVLWDGVVPLLAERFRIVRYDNRGVGRSSVPKPISAYTMAHFADDFDAVIGELSPGEPVHVLAHDWGSVGVWEYLRRPGASDRVASFTSVSGPSQDHLVNYVYGGLRRLASANLSTGDQPDTAVELHGLVLGTGGRTAAASGCAVECGRPPQHGRRHSRRPDSSLGDAGP